MRAAVILCMILSCVPQPRPIVAVQAASQPVDAEVERQEELVTWNSEVAQRTFEELRRDIEDDLIDIAKLQPCIENPDKTYYDCTQAASQP